MTLKTIQEFFLNDSDLLKYYDPFSKATTNEEACYEIYQKIIEHAEDRECQFMRNEIGYIFTSYNVLISFCVKPECRTKENLVKFGEFIKEKMGDKIHCYLFTKNTRGINFLKKLGLKEERQELITHLYN